MKYHPWYIFVKIKLAYICGKIFPINDMLLDKIGPNKNIVFLDTFLAYVHISYGNALP